MSVVFGLIVSTFAFVAPILGRAESPSRPGPFESRDSMVKTLMESGFDDVFEFSASGSKATLVSLALDSQQKVFLKRSSVGAVVKKGQNWKRIEFLDYKGEESLGMSFAGYHFGFRLYEAYKISNFAVCHKLRDSQVSSEAGEFSKCMIFPRPVDEVLTAFENRGQAQP